MGLQNHAIAALETAGIDTDGAYWPEANKLVLRATLSDYEEVRGALATDFNARVLAPLIGGSLLVHFSAMEYWTRK